MLALVLLIPSARGLDLVINEFMASNQTGIMDEHGQHVDWIEIQNVSTGSVSLAGWHLTDNPDLPDLWTFPDVTLAPGAFRLVFASGLNLTPTNGNLHANFRLNADGEYLGLFRPDQQVAHEFSGGFGTQYTDVSFGLEPGFSSLSQTRYFHPASPGATNRLEDVEWLGQVPPVTFSQTRGFHTNSVTVALACADPSAGIMYTLDGSVPSATNGVAYAGPVTVTRTDALRAVALRAGYASSPVRTHTYVFTAEAAFQTVQDTLNAGFPSTWKGFPADYGMDPDVVGPADLFQGRYAATIAQDLLDIPSVSLVMPVDDWFGTSGIYSNPLQSGTNWERACSFEFLDPAPTGLAVQVNAGVQLIGGASRSFGIARKKSFRVVFKEKYGGKRLVAPLFGADAANSFDTLVLRMESTDGFSFRNNKRVQYARDTYARELHRRMGALAARSRPVHLYLNGVYWGVYSLGERPDDEFASDYLGGRAADYDVISSGSPPDATNVVNGDGDPARVARTLGAWSNLVAGTEAVLNGSNETARTSALRALLGQNPDGSPNAALPVLLNLESYVDYLILNHWLGNHDWAYQNYYAARLNSPLSQGWTFFSWDAEWTMASGSAPTNENKIVDNRGCALPFQNLRASAEFRQYFGDRIHRHFRPGAVLFVDSAQPAFDPAHPERNQPAALYHQISERFVRPLVGESARWGDQWASVPYSVEAEWRTEQNRLLNSYLPVRTALVLQQYRDAGLLPSVDAPVATPGGGDYVFGAQLSLSAASGTVYFTLTGADPRLSGGGISPAAQTGLGPVPLVGRVSLRARALHNGEWSPLLAEEYVPVLSLRLHREAAAFRFEWNPVASVPHILESSPAAVPPVWSTVAVVTTNGVGRHWIPLPAGAADPQFYRVIR